MTVDKSSGQERSFRPRMGGRRRQVPFQRAPHFCASVLARAQVRFVKVAALGRTRSPRRTGTRCVADVMRPRADARRCIVKARIVPMNARGVKAARLHLAYIERDGVERDGSEGRLYGGGDEVDRASLVDAIPGERHQFRFIVSPEDDVDLTQFTRDLMRNVERDIGLRLQWGAVNHYDTDNPHAHVVVRGVDADGRQVWIDRAYITERMRWRAQRILTDELGPRPERDVERQLDREVGQDRLTSLDRRLARAVSPDHTTDLRRLGRIGDERERRRFVGRLQTLEAFKLATRTAPGVWRLQPDWQTALREIGERNDVITRMRRAMGEEGNPELFETIDARSDREPMEGVLRRKGLHDELRGDVYAILETPRGQAAYVRLDAGSAERLREGAIVRVAVEAQTWAKPVDRVLARVASEQGGVYDPAAHLEALRRRPLLIGGKSVAPEEVVAANVRRLERLERHQLVARIEGDRWRVPADLVQQLAARDVSHPRRLVRAETVAPPLEEQITRRGPTWLDSRDPQAPRVFYGFGSEIRTAIEQRERFVLGLGIAAEPRDGRTRALERLERQDLARKLAAEHRVTALASPPPGMRGQLLMVPGSATREPIAYMLDTVNRRLALVPVPSDLSLVGRSVSVSLDRAGQLVVRAPERGLER